MSRVFVFGTASPLVLKDVVSAREHDFRPRRTVNNGQVTISSVSKDGPAPTSAAKGNSYRRHPDPRRSASSLRLWRPRARQRDPEEPIGPGQGRLGTPAPEDGELLAKGEILDGQVGAGT